MTRTAILDIIRKKLDEMTPLGEDTSHPIDAVIDSFLDEAYLQLLNDAPIYLLPSNEVSGTVIYDTTNNIAYVPEPSDFARIVKFKFSDWENEALDFISTSNPKYKLLQNGSFDVNKVKPVVVTTSYKPSGGTLGKYFKCYSVETDDSAEYLYYVKNNDITSLDTRLIDPLTWLTTGKIMLTFEMQGAKTAFDLYSQFIMTNTK